MKLQMKFYNKINKKLHNQDGFTLSEMLASTAILLIFLVIVTSIFFIGRNFGETTPKKNLDKYMGDAIFGFMCDQIKFAGDIEVKDATASPTYEKYFKLDANEQLIFSGDTAYGNDFYHGNTLSYLVKKISGSSIELTVIISDKHDQEVYRNKTILNAVNLVVGKKELLISNTTTEMVNPLISFSVAKDQGDINDEEIPGRNIRNAALAYYDAIKLPNGKFSTNDEIRSYMFANDFGGAWKMVPQSIINKINTDSELKTVSDRLYIMPYVNNYKYAGTDELEVIVYASPNTSGWWGVALMYDHNTNQWKALKKGKIFDLVDKSKSFYNAQFADSSIWKVVG